MVYLDYAASTPVEKEVLDTFCEVVKNYYGNPNSMHDMGLKSLKKIQDSTKICAKYLGVKEEEIIYTSGATESNNLVVKGVCGRYKNRGKHILISALEHNSIVSAATKMIEQGFEVEIIPVTKEGIVDINALKKMIREDTILVSVCYVDSELGLKQPIRDIAKLLKNYPHCCFHTDASQAVGKIVVDFNGVDLATITPHKFYGLQGIGILIRKENISLVPQLDGGKSLTVYRSGTPETALIVSCAKALEIADCNLETRYDYVKTLYDEIIECFQKYDGVYVNNTKNSIPFTINFSLKNVKSTVLAEKFNEKGIYLSTKTSCCPVISPSKLVYAVTQDKQKAASSVRVSLSHLTTKEEINLFVQTFKGIYEEVGLNGKI